MGWVRVPCSKKSAPRVKNVFSSKQQNMSVPVIEDVGVWEVYCETDSKWVEGRSSEAPTECFENPAHTVSNNVRRYVTYVSPLSFLNRPAKYPNMSTNAILYTLRLRDDTLFAANGSYTLKGNTTSKMVWTSPDSPIALAGMQMAPNPLQAVDKIDMWMNKNQIVGVLAAELTSGSDTLTLYNALPIPTKDIVTEYEINLFDGVNSYDLGTIKDVKTSTSQIMFSVNAPQTFPAMTTYVRVSYHAVKNLYLGIQGEGAVLTLGEMMDGSMILPANTQCTIWYENNHPQDEELGIYFEYQSGSQNQGLIT